MDDSDDKDEGMDSLGIDSQVMVTFQVFQLLLMFFNEIKTRK